MRILNPYLSPLQKPKGFVVNGNPSANTDIANYPFTADYLDTVGGETLAYSVAPTITATGIAVVGTTTQGNVPTTNFPVNDFSMSFSVEGFDTNPATAVITEKSAVSTDYFTVSRESSTLRLVKYSGGSNTIISAGFIADITVATGYTFLVECSSTTGLRFKVDEIGGSNIVDTTTNTAASRADMSAWGATMQIGHRSATLGVSMHLSDLVIAPL